MSVARTHAELEAAKRGDHGTVGSEQPRYFPPGQQLLDALGIAAADLANDRIRVSGPGLRRLISQYRKTIEFDADWYAKTNPDVEGARLAGDVPSLHAHFVASGYMEGRLPHELPFDPNWYHRHYKDIGLAFSATDIEGMRDHYLTKGYFEGRAGTADALADAESWWRPTEE